MDALIEKMLQDDKVAGLRQVVRGVNAGRIRCVLIASDTDEHIRRELTELCESKGVPTVYCESKQELGAKLQIDKSCATVGFIKTGE